MLQFFGLFWATMALICFGALRSRPNAVDEPRYFLIDAIVALLWPIAFGLELRKIIKVAVIHYGDFNSSFEHDGNKD